MGGSLCLLVFVFTGVAIAAKPPEHEVKVVQFGDRVSVASPITIHFDRPISRAIEATIEPAALGNWQFGDQFLQKFFTQTVTFQPLVTFAPNTTYTIRLQGVRNGLMPAGVGRDMAIQFTTQPAPKIEQVAASDSSDAISPESTFHVRLNSPNPGVVVHEFTLAPETQFTVEESANGQEYTLRPETRLQQGTTYQLTIIERTSQKDLQTGIVISQSDPVQVSVTSWKTRQAPGIVDVGPTGDSIDRASTMHITFSEPMDTQDLPVKIFVEPNVVGSWRTDDQTAYKIEPQKLDPDTRYTLTIPAGVRTQAGGYLEQDAVYTFTTRGSVKLSHSSPANGATGVKPGASLSFTFDQEVDHASAEQRFSIQPPVQGSFAWSGSTLTFKPATLSRDMTYTVTLVAGIVGSEKIPSKQDMRVSFTTEPTQVRITVPYYRQQRNLSCEAAALRMALAAKGVFVSENELLDRIGVDPTPHNGNVWGDPHAAFVGNVDGRQPTTGYGVYWEPIARVGSQYRPSRAFTGGTISQITAEIAKGNPVIIWGNATTGARIDWKTPTGKTVLAINGEHTRVVKGFVGSQDNPTSIIVNDPLYGERVYSAASFDRDWSLLARSGVIVE